jgi:exonuclease VII small subunit
MVLKSILFHKESFRLKKESERLLELAKQAVEVAIEKGEKEEMKVLEKER